MYKYFTLLNYNTKNHDFVNKKMPTRNVKKEVFTQRVILNFLSKIDVSTVKRQEFSNFMKPIFHVFDSDIPLLADTWVTTGFLHDDLSSTFDTQQWNE